MKIRFKKNRNEVIFSLLPLATLAGPLAYGICQTGCNAVVVACYAAGGLTLEIITAGAGIPAVVKDCNTGLVICMTACVAAGLTPTP